MNFPSIRYLVASPAGDVLVDTHRLEYPLEADPLKTPYRTYFLAITNFLSRDDFRPLCSAVEKSFAYDFEPGRLNEIIIRTEKHGALYHPSSVECVLQNKSAKFALNVAVTETGRNALKKEYDVLHLLHTIYKLPYLPQPFMMDEMDSMTFLLEEWFEDYHEFHIGVAEDGRKQIKLWEYGKGNRFLSPTQSFEIYRQIAMILTLYYDFKTYRMIFPWHHAAGDFVVHVNEGISGSRFETKLTTARGYEPFIGSDDTLPPVLALFYFLLHLSLQMRLDRIDGVGDTVWADESCVDATLSGFFTGLDSNKSFRDSFGSAGEFRKVLQSFSKEDFALTFRPIVEQYNRTKDIPVIEKHLGRHIAKFYSTLRNSP